MSKQQQKNYKKQKIESQLQNSDDSEEESGPHKPEDNMSIPLDESMEYQVNDQRNIYQLQLTPQINQSGISIDRDEIQSVVSEQIQPSIYKRKKSKKRSNIESEKLTPRCLANITETDSPQKLNIKQKVKNNSSDNASLSSKDASVFADPIGQNIKKVKKISNEQFLKNEQMENQKFFSSLGFFCKHSWRDIRRRKFHFCLAFCSVFVVVIFTLIINTIVAKGPIIFLTLSEGTKGEIDGIVSSSYVGGIDLSSNSFTTKGLYLNYTKYLEINQPENRDKYNQDMNLRLTPRKNFCGVQMGSDETNDNLIDFPDNQTELQSWQANYDQSLKLPKREYIYQTPKKIRMEYQVCISLFDTDREKAYQVGRQYKFDPMGLGECHINSKATSTLGVEEGHIVYFDIILSQLMSQLVTKFNKYAIENGKRKIAYKQTNQDVNNEEYAYVNQDVQVFLPCKAKRMTSGTYGKFPDGNINDLQMMEYRHFLPLLSNYLPNDYNENIDFKEFLKNDSLVSLYEFADVFLLQLPSPRVDYYAKSNFDDIQRGVTVYANQASTQLGFYPVQIELGILADMQTYSQAVMFLGLIFDIIILLFIILSCLLIYSLLMISVETKTFEIGVMRMVGLSKIGLVALVILQSMLFVFPALILGFVLCFPMLKLIYGFLLTDDLGIPNDPVPDGFAVLQALIIGIVIPTVSAIIPIKVVLTKNLGDCLDYSRSKTKAIYITILQNNNAEKITSHVPIGIIAVAYGIGIYYFLPLSLLSLNYGMILRIFFFILLGMLLGLTLLAFNLQRGLEVILTHLFLFYEKRSMKLLVLKNLTAHKLRNMMTSIIFSLALGFIIFLIVAYNLQIKTSQLITLSRKGGYIVLSSDDSGVTSPYAMDPILKQNMHLIESFTYITYQLTVIETTKISQITLSDLGTVNKFNSLVYGVLPSIYDATVNDFVVVGSVFESSGLSLGEQLYTARGSQGVGMSSLIAEQSRAENPEQNYKATILMKITNQIQNVYFAMRNTFNLDKSPAFIMTDRDQSENFRHHLVCQMPLFMIFSRIKSLRSVPLQRIIIKLKDAQNIKQSNAFLKSLRSQLTPYQDKMLSVYNYNDSLQNVERMTTILNMIFNVIIAITMFLCFFSLSSSMSANLYEQSKEIGILRATGFTRIRIIFLYMYEAFILVMASSLLGILIGTLVGFSMTMQQMLFVEIPLQFFFPWQQFILVIGLSMLCAVCATVGPTRSVVNRNIAAIFRLN